LTGRAGSRAIAVVLPLVIQVGVLSWALACLPAQCLGLGAFTHRGNLPTNLQPPGALTQTSGMAASRRNPGVLWVHDDGVGGGGAQITAIRTSGALAQLYLVGATNRDWEDLTLGPGPIPGRDYLYFAETGNNSLTETSFALVRVAEPDVPAAPGSIVPLPAETFRFRYPSGTFNAETLWIDPVDGTPYVLTKENGSTCRLFQYPMPLDLAVEKTLVLVATLSGMPTQMTGGTLSADGRWVFARNASTIRVWPRPAGTSFASAFSNTPCAFAHSQGLAEAIAVDPAGRSLWAISEGSGAAVAEAPLTFPAGVPVQFAFGTGLAGAAGVPGLAVTNVPRLGGPPLVLAVWQAAANASGFVVLSLTGYPDGVVPFRGGWLHAAPDVLFLLAVNAAGTATLALGALADHPVAYGLPVSLQALVADSQAVQGVAMSAGLRLVLDR
jgi:hypothetical protein